MFIPLPLLPLPLLNLFLAATLRFLLRSSPFPLQTLRLLGFCGCNQAYDDFVQAFFERGLRGFFYQSIGIRWRIASEYRRRRPLRIYEQGEHSRGCIVVLVDPEWFTPVFFDIPSARWPSAHAASAWTIHRSQSTALHPLRIPAFQNELYFSRIS